MILSHYSKHPIKQLDPNAVPPDNKHSPGGLWLSDDSDYGWYHFVSDLKIAGYDEWSDADEILQYKTRFAIVPEELRHILILRSGDDLVRFTRRYREQSPRDCGSGYGAHIVWSKVKASYKGIIITPYHPVLSHTNGNPAFHWYRWDCASGCFWDTSCLVQLGPSQPSSILSTGFNLADLLTGFSLADLLGQA